MSVRLLRIKSLPWRLPLSRKRKAQGARPTKTLICGAMVLGAIRSTAPRVFTRNVTPW
jgi:hypothetical protein